MCVHRKFQSHPHFICDLAKCNCHDGLTCCIVEEDTGYLYLILLHLPRDKKPKAWDDTDGVFASSTQAQALHAPQSTRVVMHRIGLVWFLPPISCLSQAANPGRRFSRPGVTIAAWIRTLTMPWEVENQAGSRSREMAKTKRSYFHVLVILLCVSWLMCMHCYTGLTVSERLYGLKCIYFRLLFIYGTIDFFLPLFVWLFTFYLCK